MKNDDGASIHRKVAPLSDAAFRLNQEAKEWCSRNLTDGVIPAVEFPGSSCRAQPRYAAELVRRGLWHEAGGGHCGHPAEMCAPAGPDGYSIHDYLDYNPSAAQVGKERAAKADRQRRWLDKKRGGRQATNPSRDASQDGTQDKSRDGPEDALETIAPSPPPLPKEERGGDRPEAAAARRDAASRTGGGQHPPTHDPYRYEEDPTAIAADQQRIRQQAAETARANANGTARTLAGVAAARAAIAENRARKQPPEDPR